MEKIFVAYASSTDFQKTVIEDAANAAASPQRKITPWSALDASGSPIQKTVESWIRSSDSFVADISVPSENVTYELGYAIGLMKPYRLIRSKRISFEPVREIGLIDTLAHDIYDFQNSLTEIFRNNLPKNRWSPLNRNRDQPIFILQPTRQLDIAQKATSAVKKIARLRFRNFNPAEISRLTANEAFEDVSSSFGLVCFWLDDTSKSAQKHNQRSAFAYGIARALNIPALMLAHQSSQLPVDLQDIANRWEHLDQIDDLIAEFRDQVLEEILGYSDSPVDKANVALGRISFGDPVAENEQANLSEFFLETEAFERTLNGQTNVLTGRKGSGKSAVFFQVRDITRSDKQNIVIDLMPEGHSLIKFKEFILDHVGYGTQKEMISAFWQYVIWLEIAYKILEKDTLKAKHDHETMIRYRNLEEAFVSRVDTGKGDFSERLEKLTENVIKRFKDEFGDADQDSIKSSKVLEIIYGYGISRIREEIIDYLEHKGLVFFLFDNLDRFWTPGGYDEDDANILIGLAEALQEIERKFRRDSKDFRWALFVRSDVYEFLIAGMADYGKLSTRSIEWSDRDQLKALFNLRLQSAAKDSSVPVHFASISETEIQGQPVLDFLIEASLMRPRYLIRLVETARRRALTLGRERIIEDDYEFALGELGWQVLEDLDRETRDLVPDSEHLIFELLSHRDDLTASKLRYISMKCVTDEAELDRLIGVLIWSGALGVVDQGTAKFIYDTGYKRQYLSTLIQNNAEIKMAIHPTLCATAG